MQNEDIINRINRIRKQFFCNTPLSDIKYKDFIIQHPDYIEILLNNTVKSSEIVKYPIKINYQRAFVKEIINILEKEGTVNDFVYEEYCRLVATPSTTDVNSYKHYQLSTDDSCQSIILKENQNLITEGSTGLRTWQASLVLSEWIIKNNHIFDKQTVFELGSGIGLTGLVTCLNTPIVKYIFSDYHNSVITQLIENLYLNISDLKQLTDTGYNSTTTSVEKRYVFGTLANKCNINIIVGGWERFIEFQPDFLGNVDIILGADIVYDSELFEGLLSAVNVLFKKCGAKQFLLSCTERNQETLKQFIELAAGFHYNIEELDVPSQEFFVWSTESPVKLFRLTLSW